MKNIDILSNQILLDSFNVEFSSHPTNNTKQTEFRCKICEHKWFTTLKQIKQDRVCPECKLYQFFTYLIYFPDLKLYKIGYTNSLFRRRAQFRYKSEVILFREFDTECDARQLERVWIKNVRKYKYDSKIVYFGNSETFKY